MTCKSLFLTLFTVTVLFCGCTQIHVPAGKYETTLDGREDFAAVYNDLIFIRVKEPDDDRKRSGYWDWAGHFDTEDDGRIILKMNEDDTRKWGFHFDFYFSNGMIVVHDIGAQNSYHLRIRQPFVPMPQNTPSQFQGEFSTYK